MKRAWLAGLLLLASTPVFAAAVGPAPPPQVPLAGSQFGLSVNTATKLTFPTGTTVAVCTVESQSVRYADDGTVPTASVGTLVQIGSVVTIRLLPMTAASNVQFIGTTSGATLDCMYYSN